MTDLSFLKKHGFHRAPRAHFEGTFTAERDHVAASLVCKCCGNSIYMKFRGNPNTMSEKGIKEWILLRAEVKHECPAVDDELYAKRHKHFADIFRGNEKLKEAEAKRKFGIK